MSLPETYKFVYSRADTTPNNFEIKTLPLQKPGKDQVLVKIEYVPINPTDFNEINNVYAPGQKPVGSEGSGTVVAVGEDLTIPFQVGDKVHITTGTWGQYKLANSTSVFKVQEGLSLEDAASHFINPTTVYMYGETAQKGGHKAVVHTAASSALGKMLIRYFKHLGIKLINIVRKEEQIEELKKEGADYVLNSQSSDFTAQLKEIAAKEGATLVLDPIAGEFTNTVLKAMPNGTTVILYGGLSSHRITLDVFEFFRNNVVRGALVYNYIGENVRKGTYRTLIADVHKHLGTHFTSKVQKVFNFEDINEALKYHKENSSNGKVLLKF